MQTPLLSAALATALLSFACTTTPPQQVETDSASERVGKAETNDPERTCWFDGDVSEFVRTNVAASSDGMVLTLEWDADPVAGTSWLAPAKVANVEFPFTPRELLDQGLTGELVGDRSIRLTLPDAYVTTMRGSTEPAGVTLVLSPQGYSHPCVDPMADSDGLPFHMLSVRLSFPAEGGAKVEQVQGDQYAEA